MLWPDTHVLHNEVVGVGFFVVAMSEQLTDVMGVVRLFHGAGGFVPKFTRVHDLNDGVVAFVRMLQRVNVAGGPGANMVVHAMNRVLDCVVVVPCSKLSKIKHIIRKGKEGYEKSKCVLGKIQLAHQSQWAQGETRRQNRSKMEF